MKLGEWFSKLESNPAYSPRAPGITAAEAALRAETLTAIKKHVIQRIQQYGLEQQKSGELAEADRRQLALLTGIAAGEYDATKDDPDKPLTAYIDGMSILDGAAQHLNPQAYQKAVMDLYDGITGARVEAVMKKVKESAAGTPVSAGNIAAIKSGVEKLGTAGGMYMAGYLGEDAEKIFGAQARVFGEKAEKAARDYNMGLLDEQNQRYETAIAAGEWGTAEGIRGKWRPRWKNMAATGAVSAEQAYKSRHYFGVVDGESKGGGSAVAKLAERLLPSVQMYASSGGTTGTHPNDAAIIIAEELEKRTDAAGNPITRGAARIYAQRTLFNLWAKSNDFKGTDSVLTNYDRVVSGVKEWVKNKVPEGMADEIMKTALDQFMDGVYSVDPGLKGTEFAGVLNTMSSDLMLNLSPVLDLAERSKRVLGDQAGGLAAGNKDLAGLNKSYLELPGEPGSLSYSDAGGKTYNAFKSSIVKKVADLFAEEFHAELKNAEVNHVNGGDGEYFTVSAHGLRNDGDRKTDVGKLFRLEFLPDNTMKLTDVYNAGAAYTLANDRNATGDGTGAGWKSPYERETGDKTPPEMTQYERRLRGLE
jgi:hypothetical protein